VLDYDAAGNVIGIEVLDVREHVAEQRNKAA
jgi:YD repeat-containing protein